mmetsp:Transcript_68371/g.114410  ORF Transcript_68371/g.114410 Transcript_68371/m.114410 type:complete len:456 (+) Transcript_68371:306-1673(+)
MRRGQNRNAGCNGSFGDRSFADTYSRVCISRGLRLWAALTSFLALLRLLQQPLLVMRHQELHAHLHCPQMGDASVECHVATFVDLHKHRIGIHFGELFVLKREAAVKHRIIVRVNEHHGGGRLLEVGGVLVVVLLLALVPRDVVHVADELLQVLGLQQRLPEGLVLQQRLVAEHEEPADHVGQRSADCRIHRLDASTEIKPAGDCHRGSKLTTFRVVAVPGHHAAARRAAHAVQPTLRVMLLDVIHATRHVIEAAGDVKRGDRQWGGVPSAIDDHDLPAGHFVGRLGPWDEVPRHSCDAVQQCQDRTIIVVIGVVGVAITKRLFQPHQRCLLAIAQNELFCFEVVPMISVHTVHEPLHHKLGLGMRTDQGGTVYVVQFMAPLQNVLHHLTGSSPHLWHFPMLAPLLDVQGESHQCADPQSHLWDAGQAGHSLHHTYTQRECHACEQPEGKMPPSH